MKKPSCECKPMDTFNYDRRNGEIWRKGFVIIGNFSVLNEARGNEIHDAWMPVNFCPACGAPYKEEE